jgi:CBS domain-containing protein
MNCPSCGHENIDGIDRCDNCLAPFRDLDVPRADSAESFARSVMEDNLGELDRDETIFVAPDMPAIEVALLMRSSNTGCALVLDGKNLVGIFTEHDVLKKVADESLEAGVAPRVQGADLDVSVKELMSANPETLHERDSVASALNKMSLGRYRHIPVKKSDGTYTVASIKNVLKYIAQEDW